MISLDWKERLKIDTEDFVERKLKQNNYDIDIVYNAYPERVDNKIPSEVINYVAKSLAKLIGEEIDQHLEFFEYLWDNKGENGRLIVVHLMKTALSKNPDVFVEFIKKKLAECSNASDIKALIKTLQPLVNKEQKKYIDILFNWFNIDNPLLHKEIVNLFIRTVKENRELMKYLFHKMERGWLYPNPHTIRNSSRYLKALYKIDPHFYFSVYENYKGSRNPVFVEILCNALNPIEEEEYYENLKEYLTNWSKSGNVRIKKAAKSGLKIIGKRKNQ